MTTSRSMASRSSLLALIVVALCALAGGAEAGRKRVVVLDFEGAKADKFHDDVVKLVKAKHTVIPTEKWMSTADELDAGKVTEKNVKKVAKKLKIDAIVTGKIEKRRDEYLITIKVRGADGEIVNNVNTKSETSRVDGGASRDLNTELVGAIDALEKPGVGGGGGDDDEDSKPAKKGAKKPAKSDDDDEKPAKKTAKKPAKSDDDDDEKPAKKVAAKKPAKTDDDDDVKPAAKKGFSKKKLTASDDDDEKPAKKPAAKKSDDDDEKPAKKVAAKKSSDDDDDKPAKKGAKKSSDDDDEKPAKKKKVASDEDGETDKVEGEADDVDMAGAALSPGQRAVDVRLGLSFMARRMSFTYSSDLGAKAPPGYKGVPAPGFYLDATLFPGAISHKSDGIAKDLGVSLLVDKALLLSSQVTPPGGMATKLGTSMTRYAIGVTFRHAFGKEASAPTFEANLRYGGQSFSIAPTSTVTTAIIDIPDVSYKIIDPSIGIKYPATPKITLDATLGFMLITNTGPIQDVASYGPASVFGVEGELGGDYLVTKNVFVRAAFRFNTIGYSFKGTGAMTTMRDNDPQQDVFGARDTYIGGAITAGYLY